MEEIEKSIEDKNERSSVLEGLLGYILTSTKVLFITFPFHVQEEKKGKDQLFPI
jgi:hypothetical protein